MPKGESGSGLYPNGQKKGDLSFYKGGYHGLCVWYHDNGVIKRVANYEFGKLHGNCYDRLKNGILTKTESYKDGRRHGVCTQYSNETGKIFETITYINGVIYGLCISYYNNGSKRREGFYRHAFTGHSYQSIPKEYKQREKINGLYKHYYKNGNKEFSGNYHDGIICGLNIFYYNNGSQKIRYYYKEKSNHQPAYHMPIYYKNKKILFY